MYLFQRIVRAFRSRFFPDSSATSFHLDVNTMRSLHLIAEREQRSPEEIANQILDDALRSHEAQEENWLHWQSLTPREQEIAALVCLNYTTRQVASMLHISPETVKSHVERILLKFDAADRHALRMILSGWDFSAWDR